MQGENPSVGIGYLALPSDVDRRAYIDLCLRTSTICMRCEDGSFYTRIPITSSVVDKLEFPETIGQLGSALLFINEPIKNIPIVIDTISLPDYLPNIKEGEFKTKREWGESYAEISGSAKEERITLLLNSKNKGAVNINIISKTESGKLSVDIQGDVDIVTSKDFNVTSHRAAQIKTIVGKEDNQREREEESVFNQDSESNSFDSKQFKVEARTQDDDKEVKATLTIDAEQGERLNYTDEFKNQIISKEDEFNFRADKSKKITFGNGKEKAILGDTLLDILNKYDDLHSKATYPTAFGPSGTRINDAAFKALKAKFKTILSQLVNLD